ncbi:5793_t:CDS:2 [Diversispora eburnea]|uniref:5793_t:CDS:1 n=1 Tax=Diversispora eburnea TaxID=1213867 RepID=A0A9N8ZX39_9GLOM|nr:5793_t:CDS:2 [Diversispora eburnea]
MNNIQLDPINPDPTKPDPIYIAENIITTTKSISSLFPTLAPVGVILEIVNEILKIYKQAECNKEIANAMALRVLSVEPAIKFLELQRPEYKKKFRNLQYQETLIRLKNTLENIKVFVFKVTHLSWVTKMFSDHKSIEEMFKTLAGEYDNCMQILKFKMLIGFEEQRRIDDESLTDEKLPDEIVRLIRVHSQEVNYINENIDCFKVKRIDSNFLQDSRNGSRTDIRQSKSKHVTKRVYKGSIDVACVKYKVFTEEEKDLLDESLIIQRELFECQNILKFYGLSKIDGDDIVVFEWAELGNLREIYSKENNISLAYKVKIAFGICEGIIFLNASGVYHHDINCKNIMMTINNEPKLANFVYSRKRKDGTIFIKCPSFNWMAPEKMCNEPYTQKCEIFSFGMLMWELAYQKIPYEGIENYIIKENVKKGGREICDFFDLKPENESIQKKYIELIQRAWKHLPEERIEISELYTELSNLASNSPTTFFFDGPRNILPSKTNSLSPNLYPSLITLNEGINLHRTKKPENRERAWNCFVAHSELGNPVAIYWKAKYLLEGYHPNGSERQMEEDTTIEGLKLLKYAADEGVVDAQMQYIDILEVDKNKNKVALRDYLTRASINGDNDATYKLGVIYYNGELGLEINRSKGLSYLKVAAEKGHEGAREIIREIGSINNSHVLTRCENCNKLC